MEIKERILYFFLFFSLMHLHSAEIDEFDFYTENIDTSHLKTIEVTLPYTRGKTGWEAREEKYIIKIGNDGIIRSIVLTINDDIDSVHIYRKDNFLNIESYDQNPFINNIKWEETNIYVRGVVGTYKSDDNGFTLIRVNPESNVIYETPIIKLQKFSNSSLKQFNQTPGRALVYSNNVTEWFYNTNNNIYSINNLNSKILYKPMYNEIFGVYYGGSDGQGENSPPIRIISDDNTKIYSENQIINVINYLIISSNSVFTTLLSVMFPLLFLDNPFSKNDWSYNSSSFLKEKNAEYNPANLSSLAGLPWASANGYGIGDKITIDMKDSPNDSIIIVNGFVSEERPDLFEANSRIKQIKITNLSNGKNKIEDIEDSAKPQNISIRDLLPIQNTKLEIEVLSVYPGAKYKDLCIQAIF